MPLRKADTTTTRKFEDGSDWIELRTQLTKGEGDQVRDLTASYRLDPNALGGGDDASSVEINNRVALANAALFTVLCQGWSLGEVSADAYRGLDEESGRWVDDCIQQVLRERRERAEGNAPTSGKPRRRGSSSGTAAAST